MVYGLIVWDVTTVKQFGRILKIKKLANRLILKKVFENYTSLFQSSHIATMPTFICFRATTHNFIS